ASGGTSPSPPQITVQPVARQTISVGESVSFTVTITGSPAPALQWRRNGVDLAGATSSLLVLDNVQSSEAGPYSVVATNPAGTVTSRDAVLEVDSPVGSSAPVFTVQPASQTIASGGTVVFTAVAPGAVNFQWRRNSLPLAGATRATLVLQAGEAEAGT